MEEPDINDKVVGVNTLVEIFVVHTMFTTISRWLTSYRIVIESSGHGTKISFLSDLIHV